jgi:hypothetical protein
MTQMAQMDTSQVGSSSMHGEIRFFEERAVSCRSTSISLIICVIC